MLCILFYSDIGNYIIIIIIIINTYKALVLFATTSENILVGAGGVPHT